MVSPTQKKRAVAHVVDQRLCSERRACLFLGLHRSTYRYPAQPPLPKQIHLHQRIVALFWHHPRYGYRRIRALLAQEGWSVSRKQVQRIRSTEGLKVRPKPQRIPRQGHSTGWPTQALHRHHVWRLMRIKGVIDSSSSEHRGLLWSTARLFPFGPGQESPVAPGWGCWLRRCDTGSGEEPRITA
jgi:predicted DNA-binding transcriptional regulator AlpA